MIRRLKQSWKRRGARISLLSVALALYFVAFLVPVINLPFSTHDESGWRAFVAGWQVLTQDGTWDPNSVMVAVSWFANPLIAFAFGCITFGRWRAARLLTGLAAGLGIAAPIAFRDLLVFPAFWLWMGSAASMLAATSIRPVRRRIFNTQLDSEKLHPLATPAETLLRPAINTEATLLRPTSLAGASESHLLLRPEATEHIILTA